MMTFLDNLADNLNVQGLRSGSAMGHHHHFL